MVRHVPHLTDTQILPILCYCIYKLKHIKWTFFLNYGTTKKLHFTIRGGGSQSKNNNHVISLISPQTVANWTGPGHRLLSLRQEGGIIAPSDTLTYLITETLTLDKKWLICGRLCSVFFSSFRKCKTSSHFRDLISSFKENIHLHSYKTTWVSL